VVGEEKVAVPLSIRRSFFPLLFAQVNPETNSPKEKGKGEERGNPTVCGVLTRFVYAGGRLFCVFEEKNTDTG
jgi:hypothetical protein